MSDELESTITAYHEAGHVLLAEYYGGLVVFASILPSDDTGIRAHGLTRAAWPPADNAKKRAAQLANVALAGPVVEMIYTDEQYCPTILREWWTDWLAAAAAIQDAIDRPISEQHQTQLLSALVRELITFFSRDAVWDRVAIIADQLEAHESLEENQLCELRAQGLLG